MTTTDEALAARFGAAGLRRFEAAAPDPEAPEAPALARIRGLRLPLQVGPYFRTASGEAASLRAYAAEGGRSVADGEYLRWARLGSDGGYELVAAADGRVHALLLDYAEPPRFVSSTPELLADGLLRLDGLLETLGGTDDPQEAAEGFFALEAALREADPAAFADRESWWPLVLDDIRDTASARSYAAFEVTGPDGTSRTVTEAGGICVHAEERLWAGLRAAGVRPDQVAAVHTELEACRLPGHHCSMRLALTFPHAKVTHNFPYGATAASRGEGIRLLREADAGGREAGA